MLFILLNIDKRIDAKHPIGKIIYRIWKMFRLRSFFMLLRDLNYYYKKFKFGEDNFHNLIKKRVRTILLVSTFYDAFIFEQDGGLSDQLFGEYRSLNLSTAPRIISVPTGEEALKVFDDYHFDLVITMLRIGDISPCELADQIKKRKPDIPVLLLLNIRNDVIKVEYNLLKKIDDVFVWNGETLLFLAMVKLVEDRWNLENDTKRNLVRVILLIEDSVEYYSMFLPLLYKQVMMQTHKLITEEVTDKNKLLRFRARPKVILCHNYEDALEIYKNYKDYIITVISDTKYPVNGIPDNEAGVKLIKYLQKDHYNGPIMLQSSEESNREKANELGVLFLNKYSKTLLKDIENFIVKNLGFGDFVFRDENGNEIARAHTMSEFEEMLKSIPDESLLYHSKNNHFSAWLTAHGEFLAAKYIQPMKVEDFGTTKELREFLINIFVTVRKLKNRGKIIDFNPNLLDMEESIVRLKTGSLGGKGRGLAFLNTLIISMEFEKYYKDISVKIPQTFVIGTDEFDEFLETNKIDYEILTTKSDEEIKKIFLQGKLSEQLLYRLGVLLKKIKYPLAVRSSALLEDSQTQPFAGDYETFMIPNISEKLEIRLKHLTEAIKLVYASVFMENTRKYIETINFKLEEEKMAIIIQEIAGCTHEKYFFPHISGVAQSYNYYPISYLKNSDGIATIALGMGKSVVEGDASFKFCPAYPKVDILPQEELLKTSQTEFWAVDLSKDDFDLSKGEDITYARLGIKDAERMGVLNNIASVWDYYSGTLIANPYMKGPKVITFAGLLKHNAFPLAEIVHDILQIGSHAMGCPVEIEFAVELDAHPGKKNKKPAFYILQIRPLTVDTKEIHIDLDKINIKDLFLLTYHSMGNGIYTGIYDIVYVDNDNFDKTKTQEMVNEIDEINQKMKEEKHEYILIGPGRWGTRDRFLGIPVKWAQINKAKVIIEVALDDFNIDSSQGTHFFHNIISNNVGYFTVAPKTKDFIDWDWLKKQEVIQETKFFKHIRVQKPLVLKIDGKKGIAIGYKEGEKQV
jgi:CheY-like chemotaxis protein